MIENYKILLICRSTFFQIFTYVYHRSVLPETLLQLKVQINSSVLPLATIRFTLLNR